MIGWGKLLGAVAFVSVLSGCMKPGLEGTYVLESRDLPNGKVMRTPDIVGCMTYDGGRRNFNVYWKEADGTPVSISSIAQYELTGREYRETSEYYATNGIEGGPKYDLSPQTGNSPVTHHDGRIEFKFPLHDEPQAVFDAHGLTATRPGVFVDHWKKIR